MRKIKISFSFRDNTGNYEVSFVPFVIKCVMAVAALLVLIQVAFYLPGQIYDDTKYSGKEYYLSWCERQYQDRKFDELYDELCLYGLDGEDYEIYWEIVNAYQDYIVCKDYLAIADEKEVELSYSNDTGEQTKTVFDVMEQAKKYKQKVEDNVQNCKYERNRKYLTQFAEDVVSD